MRILAVNNDIYCQSRGQAKGFVAKNFQNKISLKKNRMPVNSLLYKSYLPAFKGENKYNISKLLNSYYFEDSFRLTNNEEKIIIEAFPVLQKNRFSKNDYNNLTEIEKKMMRKIIQKPFRDNFIFEKKSMEKDFNKIYKFSENLKNYLDKKYFKNYQIIGIGRSPDPIITVMKELGANASTIPFSKGAIDGNFYPYSLSLNRDLKKQDWERYFAHFGLKSSDINSLNRKLIFTDYSFSGETTRLFRDIFENTGLSYEKFNFESLQRLSSTIKYPDQMELEKIFMHCNWKNYSALPSAKDCLRDFMNGKMCFENYKQPLGSKLLSFFIYDKLANQIKNII